MKKIIILIISINILGLLGCANTPVATRKNLVEDTEIVIASTKKKKPNWIQSVRGEEKNFPGYKLITGLATSNSKKYNQKTLMQRAEGEAKRKLSAYISEEIKGKTESEILEEIENGEINVEKTGSVKVEQITNNQIKRAEAFDTYFEKVKRYRNNNWETYYRFYVLYGMPDPFSKEEAKKENVDYSDLNNQELVESKDALKKIKDIEKTIEELNRNGFYLNAQAGPTSLKAENFDKYPSGMNIYQDNIVNSKIVGMEIGREVYHTSYIISGNMYTNNPMYIYDGGIGIEKEFFEFWNFDFNAGGLFKLAYLNGEIAELYEEKYIDGEKYPSGSKIYADQLTYGIEPSIKVEYNMGSNFTIFNKSTYKIYKNVESFRYRIKDKYDSSKVNNIPLESFNPKINMSGLSFQLGVQYNF